MSRILFSAYFCDPFKKSEAYSAFKWLTILLKAYPVTLLTTEQNKKEILRYYDQSIPENLAIIGLSDFFPFKNMLHQRQLYIGYFIYLLKAYFLLKRNKNILRNINVIFHRNPCSFRYFTLWHKLQKKLVIGPVSGGIKPPKELEAYFKSENKFNKLRKFDTLLLKIPIYKNQYLHAEKILISGNYVRDVVPLIPSEKSTVLLETGIDCSEVKNTLVQKKNQVNILYVGRIVKYKGLELALHAANKLTNYNFMFHVVGEGNEEKRLKELVDKLNLNEFVTFHGFVNSKDIPPFYQQADIFCFPTLKEAAGNVLLEAMSYALPIVTVNYGGPKDICPESGGFKIEIASPEDMINSIAFHLELLIKDFGLRKDMGLKNKQYCLDNFDWNVHEKKIVKIFDEFFD